MLLAVSRLFHLCVRMSVCVHNHGYEYGYRGVCGCVYLHSHANLSARLFPFVPGDDIFLSVCVSMQVVRRLTTVISALVCVCVCEREREKGGGLRRSCGEIALTAVLLLFNYQLRQPPIPGRAGGWRRMWR